MASFDPARVDFAPYGFTCVRWQPSRMPRPDHHNELELNLLPGGSVTYLLGGRKVKIEAGHLTTFWAAIPHQVLDYGAAPDYFVATIPLVWFLQWNLPPRFVQRILHGEVLADPSIALASLDHSLFTRWVGDLSHASPAVVRFVSLEIEARLLRLANALPDEPSATAPRRRARSVPEAGGLNRVEQIACFIARRYREKLRIDDIAAAAGLHPNYAMNLFRRTFGTTLGDYLTHHRISHAQRLLVTSDEKIIDVALVSGFTSLSRFNEAFRRACGCSPREYRRQHRIEG
ncbi:helix-turn-helix domain-containing protein [Opitutus terrae]|uniref:Transcriptional regulator, AraC family n=1 Tax=Opitutus terrae (strain DSM 11246 / JCM 15787 / PB90-1) TaxID=452637 RepID=B1ZNN6_OPITP|nr:helix-turn-helix domain-containing protein [Opitutus terrae]ACB75406.1 transcriptional regulator, AraC family [Opitutus terrae PB90-1]